MMRIVLITSIAFLFFSCEKEKIFEYSVDPAFEKYVEQFFVEASLRGVSLKRENLIIEFTNSPTNDFCGQCTKGNNGTQTQRKIKIQNNRTCWSERFEENKETLIFHELGHCFLDRGHFDEYFEDGSPKSIMTTFDEAPFSRCIYDFDGGNDSSLSSCNKIDRRTYYIDELFGVKNEKPFWLE